MWKILRNLNINFYLIIIFVLLALAASSFYYQKIGIPRAEKAVLSQADINFMEKQKVAVVKEGAGISKYTQLSREVVEENIEIKEVPLMFSAKDIVSSKESLINKFAREDFSAGEQIIRSKLAEEARLYRDFDRLKEYCVSNLVADKADKGSLVDLVVNYGTGDYDVLLPKRRIVDMLSNMEGKDRTYTMVFEVDEIDYRDLELAQQLGSLEIRLYIDESQPASLKTFDFDSAINKLQIKGNTDKSKNTGDSERKISPDNQSEDGFSQQ